MRHHLVVGIGLVEGFTLAQLQDHRLGFVHQVGFVGDFQALLLGDLLQLTVRLGVIVDHHLGEFFDILRGAFFQRHLGGFDFRQALGGSLVDELFGGTGGRLGECGADAQHQGKHAGKDGGYQSFHFRSPSLVCRFAANWHHSAR